MKLAHLMLERYQHQWCDEALAHHQNTHFALSVQVTENYIYGKMKFTYMMKKTYGKLEFADVIMPLYID